MVELSQEILSIVDGNVIINAEALAPKLGLLADALKDEMAKGLVTSVLETGLDQDAGRMRVTFRYRARVWRVAVETDGAFVEQSVSPDKPTRAKDRLSLLVLPKDTSGCP